MDKGFPDPSANAVRDTGTVPPPAEKVVLLEKVVQDLRAS